MTWQARCPEGPADPQLAAEPVGGDRRSSAQLMSAEPAGTYGAEPRGQLEEMPRRQPQGLGNSPFRWRRGGGFGYRFAPPLGRTTVLVSNYSILIRIQ